MERKKALLASDLDGTVIPLEDALPWRRALEALRRALEANPDVMLAYVTGRDFELARRGMKEHGLPGPDFLVCDVGTSVFRAGDEGGFEPDDAYSSRMEGALGGVKAEDVHLLLETVAGLERQPPGCQTPFKISYFLNADAPHRNILTAVDERLVEVRDRIRPVYSVRPEDGVGLLDLLPAGVAKDFAVRYLQEVAGVDTESMVYAGDSGNDLAAFLAGYRTIVVGNAPEDLEEKVREESRTRGLEDRIYFAEGKYAAGVLEGCRHFGLF